MTAPRGDASAARGASRASATAAIIALAVVAGLAVYLTGGLGDPDVRDPAAMFACGEDVALPQEIPLSREAVFLAADGRRYAPCAGEHPPNHLAKRQQDVLERALASDDPVLVRAAIVGLGRMGPHPEEPVPAAIATLLPWLDHRDPGVRRVAAQAIGDTLDGVVREPISREWLARAEADAASGAGAEARAAAASTARAAIEARLGVEPDQDVSAALYETLGRLPYATDAEQEAVEVVLAAGAADSAARLGAVRGLETLIRRSPRRAVSPATIATLREAATGAGVDDDGDPRIRRTALLALAGVRDADIVTLTAAVADNDWQARRLAVARLNAESTAHAPLVDAALRDPAFQVRLEALRIVARRIARTNTCGPLVEAMDDPEVMVVLAALDQMPDGCAEEDAIVEAMEDMADLLEPARDYWHVPARALVAIARIAPDRARLRLPAAAAHPVWQVRTAAAEVAGRLDDGDVAATLAADEDPNVRIAALRVLTAVEHPAWFDAALEGLRSEHHDLVRVSAGMLGESPDRARAVEALLDRLDTLTARASDTSRDPRLAIIRQLGELMERSEAAALAEYVKDFDPRVGFAAREAYIELTRATDVPVTSQGARARYPYQPSAAVLASAPKSATIRLDDGGVVELELLVDDALVAVARFAELARAGYYDGLTFHRVVPTFVIQGGSPGANEYVGADRYMRDAIGVPNDRGTVGLSTRGRDTGDAQFFVNMVDNPRLDHTYSVFARVTSGMDVLDRVLPGVRIASVTVR